MDPLNNAPQDVFDMEVSQDIFDDDTLLEPYKEENLPWYESYPNALIKGLAEGTIGFGEMMSGNPPSKQEENENIKLNRNSILKKYLPSNKGAIEEGLERSGKVFPMIATGGANPAKAAISSLLSGASGQTAKELGFGETGQAIAETAPLLIPDFRKMIPIKNLEQKELADFARRQGMTEEELTLAISGKEPGLLEELASKGGKTVKSFKNTSKALGRIWNTLSNSEVAQMTLKDPQSSHFINGLMNRMEKLPSSVRELISEDLKDLIKSDMKGSDIINFWQDVNHKIKGGEKSLGILKEDLSKALRTISPELEKDFKLTNELYGNFSNLASRMGPDIAEKLIKAGEGGILVSAIVDKNYPLLKAVLGTIGGRALAREMVINPRLQNLSQRFLNSLSENTPAITKRYFDQMIMEVGKKNAEAAAKMSELDINDFYQ